MLNFTLRPPPVQHCPIQNILPWFERIQVDRTILHSRTHVQLPFLRIKLFDWQSTLCNNLRRFYVYVSIIAIACGYNHFIHWLVQISQHFFCGYPGAEERSRSVHTRKNWLQLRVDSLYLLSRFHTGWEGPIKLLYSNIGRFLSLFCETFSRLRVSEHIYTQIDILYFINLIPRYTGSSRVWLNFVARQWQLLWFLSLEHFFRICHEERVFRGFGLVTGFRFSFAEVLLVVDFHGFVVKLSFFNIFHILGQITRQRSSRLPIQPHLLLI